MVNVTMYARGTFAKFIFLRAVHMYVYIWCVCVCVCIYVYVYIYMCVYVYVLFYVSTKEGEKYLAFDIESQYFAASADVKLSRSCVRVVLWSPSRYWFVPTICALCWRIMQANHVFHVTFDYRDPFVQRGMYIRIDYKIIFDVLHLFFFRVT